MVNRYDVDGDGCMDPYDDGPWVLYDDYQAQAARIEQLEGLLRNVVSHATGGETTGEGMGLNDISVKITAMRNRIYSDAKATARNDALREAADHVTETAKSWRENNFPQAALALFDEAKLLRELITKEAP